MPAGVFRRARAALLAKFRFADCWLLRRFSETGEPRAVLYYVPADRIEHAAVGQFMDDFVGRSNTVVCVPVSCLPLTPQGDVDEDALTHIPSFDNSCLAHWERKIEAGGSTGVAIVLRNAEPKTGRLHLTRLLPDYARSSGQTASATSIAPSMPSSAVALVGVPSFREGAPLEVRGGFPATLLDGLHRSSASDVSAITHVRGDLSYRNQSHRELLDNSRRVLCGLRRAGLTAGDIVLLQVEESAAFLPAYWACLLGGMQPASAPAPASFDPQGPAAARFGATWKMLGGPLVVCRNADAAALEQLANRLGLGNFRLAVVETLLELPPDNREHQADPEATAIILMTSGSTGSPKGVVLSHRNVLSMVAGMAQMHSLSGRDVFLNWFPLNHVGSAVVATLLPIVLWCSQVHAPKEPILQDPLRWLDLIHRFRATITWAPNFAYQSVNTRLAQGGHRDWDLSSVSLMINAGEAVLMPTVLEFLERLKPYGLRTDAVKPCFGMSETCAPITVSLTVHRDMPVPESSFAPLGVPIPGAASRIVDDRGRLVAEGTPGRIQLRGPSIFRGYHGRRDLTAEVFEDGWLKTGDLGFMKNGEIVFTGREKDTIVLNGEKFSSQEIERIVEEVEGVDPSHSAAVSVREDGRGSDRLAVFLHTRATDDAALRRVLRSVNKELGARLGIRAEYLVPVDPQAIPRSSIGKILRSQLKSAFESGDFRQAVEHAELVLGAGTTLPDWFFRQAWVPRQPDIGETMGARSCVIFLDAYGLGRDVSLLLGDRGILCTLVEAGNRLEQISDREWKMDGENPLDYREVLTRVSQILPIGLVLHLGSYGRPVSAQSGCLAEVMHTIQALDSLPHADVLALRVVSSYAHAVAPGDCVGLAASIPGLLRAAANEQEWLDVRHIDMPPGNVTQDAQILRQELANIAPEPQVAWRSGRRFVSRFTRRDLSTPCGEKPAIREGGCYLLAGGLGGVGVAVAQYLLSRGARLLIIGRSRGSEFSAEQAKILQMLDQLGDVQYASVDVADSAALRERIKQQCERWGAGLDGVFHLSAVAEEKPLGEETPESLAACLRSKVDGTLALAALVADRTESVLVLFASVAGLLGSRNAAAYSAANSFQVAYGRCLAKSSRARVYTFAFSAWEETGLSRNGAGRDVLRAGGLHTLTPDEGISCLRAAFWRAPGDYIVGVDASHRRIRPWVVHQPVPIQEPRAFVETVERREERVAIVDPFGTRSELHISAIPMFPARSDGSIDRERLAQCDGGILESRAEPATETERQVAAVMQLVLRTSPPGAHDNFFDLGGDSLRAAQLIAHLGDRFGVTLSLRTVFESPTVAGIAEHLREIEPRPGTIQAIACRRAEVDRMTPDEVEALLRRKQGKQTMSGTSWV